ncbi:MAG TPA: ROK family transcriptional regulator [Gaiella sp.]|jgi:predicted NBD/HSP70 family sugar kinase
MTFDRGAAHPADQTTVRRANLGVVLRHVAATGSQSRAQIAAETGLTRATVSSLVSELIARDLLHETGETTSPRGIGRPGTALELSDVVVGVGLEVNVDYVAVSVEDLTGTVRYGRRFNRDNRESHPRLVLDRIGQAARDALAAAAADGLRPVGVTVAVAGLVEEASGTVVLAPNMGWVDLPVAAELGSRLGLHVVVENEANLSALAEHWTGAAVGIDDFVCVFGEVGVGGGIVLGGQLFRGTHGFGGEFGHISVDPDEGRSCACGSRGCVETLAGQESIARAAGISPVAGRPRSLTDELVRRAQDGAPAVLTALDDAGRWLGIALASAFNLLDLSAVVLGGCFGPLAPWLADGVRTTLQERSLAARSGAFVVLPSAFGDGAAVRGAAALSLRRVLDTPWIVATTARHEDGHRPASARGRRGEEVGIGRR